MKFVTLPLFAAVIAALAITGTARADATKPVVDFGAPGIEGRITPNSPEGSAFKIVDGPFGRALEVDISPGPASYPGVVIKPDGGNWDMSAFGEIDVDITNLSTERLSIVERIDNPGSWQANPWDADHTGIAPGKSATVKVVFGYSWGNVGYALDPSKISQIMIFSGKAKVPVSFRIDRLYATGKPGEKPAGLIETLKPVGGVLLDPHSGFPDARIEGAGATATLSGGVARVVFASGVGGKLPRATFKAPDATIWNLTDYNQAEFTLTNPGSQTVHAVCRVDNKFPSDTANSAIGDVTLPAGASKTVIVSFMPSGVNDLNDKATAPKFNNDGVIGATIESDTPGATVVVKRIVASVAPTPEMPAWLGQRPPVPGNWTKTFEDNFDGKVLDPAKWTLPEKPEASYWDSSTVNAAGNAYIASGCMVIKCEKPAVAPTYDDPKLNSRRYVTSVVTTFDKFAQRYGYFEARVKVPTTMGMWPAFWLMPDRGKEAGAWYKRNDTKNGGMEFDILEYLTRFGPYHYNIAMHWDGYTKLHKSVGNELTYCQPDKDGFITAGLLWGPGEATYYANSHPVLTWKDPRIGVTPEYVMFTMPVGGWGTNGYIDDSKLPATFQIDYCRIWQKDDWAALPKYDITAPVPVATPALPPAQ